MQETQEMGVRSLGQEDPLEEGMATHSRFLPGESHGQRSLAGYRPWGRTESDTTAVTEYALLNIKPDKTARSRCVALWTIFNPIITCNGKGPEKGCVYTYMQVCTHTHTHTHTQTSTPTPTHKHPHRHRHTLSHTHTHPHRHTHTHTLTDIHTLTHSH